MLKTLTLFLRKTRLLAAVPLLCAVALGGCKTTAISAPQDLASMRSAVLVRDGFVKTEDGWVLGLTGKLLFDTDEDKLTPESRQAVLQIGRSLGAVGLIDPRVLGYTDSTGSETYNNALSMKRAAAVTRILVDAGMTSSHIRQQGAGKRNPVVDNRTAQGRAQNRRVVIIVLAE
jgi:outer membrane protein OmpA-like peptidoglycan-associated protein